jgi:hypothetical protein
MFCNVANLPNNEPVRGVGVSVITTVCAGHVNGYSQMYSRGYKAILTFNTQTQCSYIMVLIWCFIIF